MTDVLELRNVRFGYARKREVLHGVSATMRAGELTAIVGPNGCGKTTLLTCINRINKPWSGAVVLTETGCASGEKQATSQDIAVADGATPTHADGAAGSLHDTGADATPALSSLDLLACPLPQVARTVGYVPQRTGAELAGSVVDYLLLGRRQFLSWRLAPEDLDAVREVLARLGIENLANAEFAQLSGGERQQVLIARALLQQPQALLLDEPTNSLDIAHQRQIMDLAASLAHNEGKIVVAVLHDLSAALHYADHVVLMNAGGVVAAGSAREVLTPEALEHVYGLRPRINESGSIDPFAR